MGNSFAFVYRCLLDNLLENGSEETNVRTGHVIRTVEPQSFTLDLSDNALPVPDCRKVFPKTAAAEIAWYLMGTRDPAFIRKHAPIWDKFLEPANTLDDDSPKEIISAAYGYRWRRHWGRDQIALSVEALKRDSSDRRVYVSAWDPSADGLGATGQKNVPCPIGFTFSIVDGRLNSTVLMRSSDVFVGLPYDVMGHTMLMDVIARSISRDVKLGHMQFSLAHPHLYDSHFEAAKQALLEYEEGRDVLPELYTRQGFSVDDVVQNPDEFVAQWATMAKCAKWPEYSPRPEIVQ